MKKLALLSIAVSLTCTASMAQIGIFEANLNIGDPAFEGLASEDDGTFTVESVGGGLGFRSLTDQFQFVYTQMSGNFAIEGDIFPAIDPGRGGLMIRQDLDPDSKHVSFMRVSGTFAGSNTNAAFGSVFPTFRSAKGGGTVQDGDPEPGGFTDFNIGPIRIERIGNSFHLFTRNIDDEWQLLQTEVVPMDDPVFVGLAATADNNDAFGEFEFIDVAITPFPLTVTRDLPTDDIEPGATLTGITVTASSDEAVNAVITEVPPLDAVVSNVSASGGSVTNNPNGTISWVLDNFTGEQTLTYDVTLGPRGSAVWQGTFNDGVNLESFIGGETLLPKVPVFNPQEDPVSVGPDEIKVFQIENFRLFDPDDPDAFGLGINPRTNSGIHVVNVSGSAGDILEFPIMIEQTGTYFFFGQVRGEDGNSDSWHFEIDLPPAGNNSTRWDSGNSGAFVLDYVSSNDPALNPRPFELDAGEHFIMVANREDSTSIDWVAITTDPNLSLGQFDDITAAVPEPIPFANINVANPVPKEMVNGEGFCEAEEGYLVVTPADGPQAFSILEERGASNGQIVNNVFNNTGSVDLENRLDYFFNITEPGTYRIIANTRTPTGSDDSFWVGMDNEELVVSGIDDAFLGSGIQDNNFHSSWVETNNIPDQSWDLDVGVHVINLYPREDGTQIDWLILTNNLDQDATIKTPPVSNPGSEVQNFMLY